MNGTLITPTGTDSTLLRVTHIVYALHALGLAIGAFGAATVLGSFLFGWPSIIAVILNYVYRGQAQGTWLESHFRWQIRTFWFALLWVAVAVLAGLTIVGLPFAWIVALGAGLWVLYRIVRGWLRLVSEKGMPQ